MHFLPDDIVPDRKRDGEEVCRKLLGSINFYMAILKASELEMADLTKMFAQHSSWYRNKNLQLHERAMMCALATMIAGNGSVPRLPSV